MPMIKTRPDKICTAGHAPGLGLGCGRSAVEMDGWGVFRNKEQPLPRRAILRRRHAAAASP